MPLTVKTTSSTTGEILPWYRALRDSRLDLSAGYIIREKKGQVGDTVEGGKKSYIGDFLSYISTIGRIVALIPELKYYCYLKLHWPV